MRLASAFCFLLLSLLTSVYCSPVPGRLIMKKHASGPPHAVEASRAARAAALDQKRFAARRPAALRKANKEANSQYKHMQRVLADHNKPEHKAIIKKAFGDNPNLEAIKKNVEMLKKKNVFVQNVKAEKPGSFAFSRKNSATGEKGLHFTSNYFNKKTAKGQAGTLIHEASHQLFDTKDNFVKEGNTFRAISKGEIKNLPQGSVVKSGYLHKDFDHLKEHASPVMHLNADSYKAFGHYAKYGENTPMDHKVEVHH